MKFTVGLFIGLGVAVVISNVLAGGVSQNVSQEPLQGFSDDHENEQDVPISTPSGEEPVIIDPCN